MKVPPPCLAFGAPEHLLMTRAVAKLSNSSARRSNPAPIVNLRTAVLCNAHQGCAKKSLFIFGVGYTGSALAKYAKQHGWHVAGTTRDCQKVSHLNGEDISTFTFGPDTGLALCGEGLDVLHEATHVLSSIPPSEGRLHDPVLAGAASALQQWAASSGAAQWLGYLSSTSVYGDWQGAWVDERSELRAASGKGLARRQAEAEWLALHAGLALPVHIFRLGGIYGPNRSALDAAAAEPGLVSSSQRRRALQRYTARCHVLDICRVLLASMEAPRPGATYNVVDDCPAPRSEVMAFARELMGDRGACGAPAGDHCIGVPALSGSRQPLSKDAATASRPRMEEKRVRNDLVKAELGVELAFPTYQEGLTAIHAGDRRPFC